MTRLDHLPVAVEPDRLAAGRIDLESDRCTEASGLESKIQPTDSAEQTDDGRLHLSTPRLRSILRAHHDAPRDQRQAMKTRKYKSVKGAAVRLRRIEAILRRTYGSPRHYNPTDPLDDLIFLVLSRMTQEVKYRRTYAALRESMPDWGIVRDAPPNELEELLADAGLAMTKTSQIQAILKEVEHREGKLDLARLRALEDEEIEQYLTSLPGVGRKTARCVMLYALGRPTCPVDTHVWRVMQRLGFAPARQWNDQDARHLEESIPEQLRPSLHVTLVAHGRSVCRAPKPICSKCVLAGTCPSCEDARVNRGVHAAAATQ